MIFRRDPTWRDYNRTVGTYVPLEVYEGLVQISDERTKTENEWWSVSRVIREILTEAVAEAKHGERA